MVGGEGGGRGGGKLKAGNTIHGHSERAIVCSLKHRKQPQCTCQAKTVVGSSLTPHATLLIHPSDTRYPTMDRHEFTRSEQMLPVEADLAVFSPVIGVY